MNDDEDFEESNANLSNEDDAKAEPVIASSPAFSHELKRYTQRVMSGTESINTSINNGSMSLTHR